MRRRPRRTRGRPRCAPRFEMLELRKLLATVCNVISGFVFNDTSGDGIYEFGEPTFPNSPVELLNAQGQVVATATTNSAGAYQFMDNATVPNTGTDSHSITYPDAITPTSRSGTIPQFNPALGTLTSVQITDSLAFTDRIQVESLDASPAVLTATVQGSQLLNGPGVANLPITTNDSVTFNATAYDGVTDFGGTSGHDFGFRTQNGSNTVTLNDAANLAAYTGTGSVSFAEQSTGTSAVTGAGNVVQVIGTSSAGTVNVVYHYTPTNCFTPGNYTVVLTQQPPGFNKTYNSHGDTILPGSFGTDSIPVALGTTNSLNNNFALALPVPPPPLPSSLSGFVYLDANNDGLKEPGEAGLGGVLVTLTGTTTAGAPVFRTATTLADGSYSFTNLAAGSYSLVKTPPAFYLDGKDAIGSQGGTAPNPDLLTSINLAAGVNGVNNNFAELIPNSLSGYSYFDANNDGIKEATEFGIARVAITLVGVDDLGHLVDKVVQTGYDGSYAFGGLRPGTYALIETQPSFFLPGKDTIGSQGGVTTSHAFSSIALGQGINGIFNNFGNLARPGCKLLGLTEYHIKPGHQLPSSRIGPLLRLAVPSLVPLITAPGTAPVTAANATAKAVASFEVAPKPAPAATHASWYAAWDHALAARISTAHHKA